MIFTSLSKRYANVVTAVAIVLTFAMFYMSSSEPELDPELTETLSESSSTAALVVPDQEQSVPDKTKVNRRLDQAEQKLACRILPSFTSKTSKTRDITLHGKQFTMEVFKENDIVSQIIAAHGTWETGFLDQILKGLKIVSKKRGIEKAVFIDIGANVGWYALAVASQGYQVIAFEPMPQNEALFRSSLCLNPEINDRVLYYAFGLGKVTQVCDIWSHNINLGDGQVACDNKVVSGVTDNKEYTLRATINVHKLDDVMENTHLDDVAVIKMDTEGFELNVINGGMTWLKRAQPPYIVAEFSPYLMKPKGISPPELLKTVHSLGYDIHIDSWEGKMVPPSEFATYKGPTGVDEIYLVSRAWKNQK